MKNGIPFINCRHQKPWTEEDDDLLLKLVSSITSKPNFPIFTLCFPGRKSKDFYHQFLQLAHDKNLFDLECLKHPFNFFIRRYFLQKTEKTLASEITQLFRKGIQITQNMIHDIAIKYYETP